MSVVVCDPDIGDVDPEAEDRDQFHVEEMLNEWNDEPPIRHDVYPESDAEENGDGPERVHTHIRRGDGHLYHKQTFFSGVAFKEAVVDYALRTGCNLKQYRYDNDKIGFKCVGNDGKEEGVRCEGVRCEWLAPEDYVCHWFRTSTWKKNYTDATRRREG
ncbi:unnamed protein product [Arabidopsis lyrata]|nr:unnamed protein product [Arabidopsis lyrata]